MICRLNNERASSIAKCNTLGEPTKSWLVAYVDIAFKIHPNLPFSKGGILPPLGKEG